jgi:hypothetical protein
MTPIVDPRSSLDPLDRHQRRRENGIPTVSVLSGPVVLGARRWRAWAAARGVAVATLSRADLGEVVCAWTRSLASTHDLAADAFTWLARVTGQNPDQLRQRVAATTDHDFEWFWSALPISSTKADPAAVCRILLKEATGHSIPERIPERLLGAIREGRVSTGIQAVASLAEVASERALPTLLFMPTGDGGAAWLAAVARFLTELVAGVPRLAAAVAIEATVADAVLRTGPQTHALAVLREGLEPVEALDEKTLTDRLRSAGVAVEAASTARRLAEDGASGELATALIEAARCIGKADTPDEEDAARSAAERFLFERLETLAATAGLFALNQPLDFHHGPALAEVDLLAGSLRLVIELDGSYYHLRDPSAYRRDRRKDWELQRRGYLVLRFLSEDVVRQMEEILDTILSAVELRRASQPERGHPA